MPTVRFRPLLFAIGAAALLASACGSTVVTVESGAATTTIPDAQPSVPSEPETGEPDTTGPDPAEPATTEPENSEPSEPFLLLGGGSSFGECTGFCLTTLTIDGPDLIATQSTWNDEPDHVSTGTLSELGIAAAIEAGASITDADLDEIYGCPDCADGGAEWISFSPSQSPAAKVTFEFGNAPATLTTAATLIGALIDAMLSCQTTDLVTVGDDCVVAQN